MPALLGLDTATEACTTGLWLDGEVRVRHMVAPRGHADRILGDCAALLEEAGLPPAQLDAVAVGRGPGSFTGVRIGVGVAQGLAHAAGRPVVPVSTLAVIAQGVLDAEPVPWVAVAVDARMGEVYWGLYRRGPEGLAVRVGEERVCPPEAVAVGDEVEGCAGAGTGWAAHGEVLGARLRGRLQVVREQALPHAAALLRLAAAAWAQGKTVPAAEARPVYLRDRVAHQGRAGG